MNDEDLFNQFRKMNRMFHRYHMKNHMAFGPMGDPHRGQGRILSLLKMQPEMSQRDLSFILGIRPQSLGEMLVKLERNGYIVREQSEDDRRAMIVRITEEGRKMAEEHAPPEHFSCLNEEEKEQLGEFLQRITDNIKEEIGEDEEHPLCGMDEEQIKEFMKENMRRIKENFHGMEGFRGPGFI